MMAESKLTVGIADMKLLQGSGLLVTYALGSCIGLCFHDQIGRASCRERV